jgi:hypothetical protein
MRLMRLEHRQISVMAVITARPRVRDVSKAFHLGEILLEAVKMGQIKHMKKVLKKERWAFPLLVGYGSTITNAVWGFSWIHYPKKGI